MLDRYFPYNAIMPAMQYFEKAQSSFKPPLVANENAFLGDVGSSYVPVSLSPISHPFPFLPNSPS
jgi:hypothetical protein